jgi:aquaporin Z
MSPDPGPTLPVDLHVDHHVDPSLAPPSTAGVAGHALVLTAEQRLEQMVQAFDDPTREWRRLCAELLGTFFLVLVAAGGPMMATAFPGSVSRTAAVVAPALMVMAVILSMGKVSGAHLNPAVSVAFALRSDFPWRRVPGYVVVQFLGGVLAAWFLQSVIHVSASHGTNVPHAGVRPVDALLLEVVLTLGLVTVILGTASGAQQVGLFGAIGVGAYIALAGLWASPLSGTSMNPVRTLGPDLVAAHFPDAWIYVVGPLVGAALAVGAAFALRGPGGGRSGSLAAQGEIRPRILRPDKA